MTIHEAKTGLSVPSHISQCSVTMATTTPFRRSGRNRVPTKRSFLAVPSPRVKKRRSPRLAQLNSVQEQVVTQHIVNTRMRISLYQFIVNDTSNSPHSEEDNEEDEDTESNFETSSESSIGGEEDLPLSNDNFEYMAGDSLERRESYDSRLQSGNEEYIRDGFVVDSEDEYSDWSEAGSEITISQSLQDEQDEIMGEPEAEFTAPVTRLRRSVRLGSTGSIEAESETSVTRLRRSARLDSAVSVGSMASSGSESSGLFVTDSREEMPEEFPFSNYCFRPIPVGIEPSDVEEEITEVVVRFARRCNRFAPPMCLELTRRFFEDEEVTQAIMLAVDRGFCTFKQVSDEKLLCVVGIL
jgi:hypothetical protein